MSEKLIDRLVDDLRPVRAHAMSRRLLFGLGLGAAAAALLVVGLMGLRPDYPEAFGSIVFWLKFAYTAGFALLGFAAARRLARPGGRLGPLVWAMALLFGLAVLAGLLQLLRAPPEASRALIIGSSALLCPILIVVSAMPIYAAMVVVMRRLAPTDLGRAGFAAGLLAGGAGSWVYAFHCSEGGLPFLALWYTAGILASGAIGALLGRRLLRWA